MEKTEKRTGWVDLLRIVACAMVVLSHCCDGFVAQFDTDRESFMWGAGIGSLMRPCVPLFVMMTGVLLLPVKPGVALGDFYRKRIGRLLPPLVFWSLALPALAYAYFTGWGAHTANPSVDLAAYTPAGLGNRLWSWVLNFNFDTTPLWYLYMLLGLYMVIPVMSAWLDRASKRDVQWLLGMWALSLLIPYLKLFAPALGYTGNYGNMELFGGCDWNAITTFHYVSGFAGYLLLAYYLKRWPVQWSNVLLGLMFIAGYAITFGGFVAIQTHYPGDYAYLEIVWYFTGVNVMMMTVPMFVWGQRLKVAASPAMAKVAGLTFGVYLCHFFFVMVGYDVFASLGLPPLARILLTAATVFGASLLLTRLLSMSKLTARLVR